MAAKKKLNKKKMYATLKRMYRIKTVAAAKEGKRYGIKQLAYEYAEKYGEKPSTFYERIKKKVARDKAAGEDWNTGLELLVRSEEEVKFDDERYQGETTDMAAFMAGQEYGTLEGICLALKIPRRVINRWMKQYESFSDCVHDGLANGKAKVEYTLKQQGQNQTLTETKVERYPDGKEKVIEIEKEVRGSVQANKEWLKANTEKYNDKQETAVEEDVIEIVIGG